MTEPTNEAPTEGGEIPRKRAGSVRSSSAGEYRLAISSDSLVTGASASSLPKKGSSRLSSPRMAFTSARPVPGQEQSIMGTVDTSLWVPDEMALSCCICRKEFNMVRRRHHCRTCGRVCCDDCSSKRIKAERTCDACWDRLGRKMSGLGLESRYDDDEIAASARGVRKSALVELLEEERYNRSFVLADGRKVSYSVAGITDGLPVFLFLGLDSHRQSAAHFEDLARRRGLRLICIDRPGRGKSDNLASTPAKTNLDRPVAGGGSGRGAVVTRDADADPQEAISEAIEAAVVDTVKQMCASFRIEKAAVMGQSLGALFALRCARDEGLKDLLQGTTVCLVSPWVPLAAPGCNTWLQKASTVPALTSTAKMLGGEIMVTTVSEMARGSGGANEVEKGYLEAPYTQDLIKHVTGLKEGRGSVKNEVYLALANKGEEEAKERCAAVMHATHIWHGRSDQLVPFAAMKWLERSVPSCMSTVVPGGTHALMYDKGTMEDVFSVLQKGISDARSTARFAARRLSSQLSYVASSVFSSSGEGPSADPNTASGGGAVAGSMSPRSGGRRGEKAGHKGGNGGAGDGGKEVARDGRSKSAAKATGTAAGASPKPPPPPLSPPPPPPSSAVAPKLTERLVRAISKSTGMDSSAHSTSSANDNADRMDRRGGGRARGSSEVVSIASAVAGSATSGLRDSRQEESMSPFGSEHGPLGSGHESSGHGPSWHGLGSGHGQGTRRPSSGSSGSRHGVGGSRHGSETAPASIPENGELLPWGAGRAPAEGEAGEASDAGGLFFSEVGRRMSRALSEALGGSEHGSVASTSGEHMPPLVPRGAPESAQARVGGGGMPNGGSSSGAGSGSDVGRVAEEFMRHLDRAVTSISIGGGGSGHGSAWGGSVSAGGSAHGSVVSLGVGGGGGGVGASSRRSSAAPLPWSDLDVRDAVQDLDFSRGPESRAPSESSHERDIVGGFRRGLERALSAVGVGAGTPRALSAVSAGGTPRSVRGDGGGGDKLDGTFRRLSLDRAPSSVGAGTPRSVLSAADVVTPGSVGSGVAAADKRHFGPGYAGDLAARPARAPSAAASAAGYEAAMANWPAGKIEGNPAWEEWPPEKKLFCHFVTAGCLAIIVITW